MNIQQNKKLSEDSEIKVNVNDLIKNGIDFLDMAYSQIESNPKHSIINFSSAVEIFLKVPLAYEHWSLIIADRNPNKKKYKDGDFVSVSFDDACARLELILEKPLKTETKDIFNKIRKHRNRMVHFYHDQTDSDEIKREQAQAWFELNRFISEDWKGIFEKFPQILFMKFNLLKTKYYAEIKYKDLEPEINKMKKKGTVFQECPQCKTEAYYTKNDTPNLYYGKCLVCFFNQEELEIDCPQCNTSKQYIKSYEGFICDNCDDRIRDLSVIFKLIDQEITYNTEDYIHADTPANCHVCEESHTVCKYENGYLCCNCLTFFNSIQKCEYCGDNMTGDYENTYIYGCGQCEGFAAKHMDD